MNREDFSIFKNTDIVYFDNAATTMKPEVVVNEIMNYNTLYTSNIKRGDYKNSYKVSTLYENTRQLVKDFINAKEKEEIIFTYGCTDSLNMAINGFFKNKLKENDEVIISKTDHASLILPFLKLQKEIGIKVVYAPLDKDLKLDIDKLEKIINPNTKVIATSHVTNATGDIRDIEKIGLICKNNNLYFLVDAAQSIGHMKVDVQKSNIDFLAFSAHKMLGPTGIGVLYGKKELLKDMDPVRVGGGMNNSFDSNGDYVYKEIPYLFEAGTPNIEGVIGMGEAIKYLNNIGLDNIKNYENKLKEYLVSELSKIDNIKILNNNPDSATILFNIDNVFSQDTALYLDNYNICTRAGSHCAKLLKDELGIENTCRISLYFYNTKEEIDKLINVLKNSNNIFDVVI